MRTKKYSQTDACSIRANNPYRCLCSHIPAQHLKTLFRFYCDGTHILTYTLTLFS